MIYNTLKSFYNEHGLLFFANAPIMDYPYFITTYKKRKELSDQRRSFDIGILDLGVYTYLVKSKDHRYPQELIKGMIDFVNGLTKEQQDQILVSSCDYPGLNFEHGIMIDYDNLELTLENWKLFMKTKNPENVIYTVQLTTNDDLSQAKHDIEQFPKHTPSNIIGIGSLCRVFRSKKDKEFFEGVIRYTRERYPTAFIHVWGAGITNVDTMVRYVNSFDNSKWTRPVNTKILPNHSAKDPQERIRFFEEYVKVIDKKKEQHSIVSRIQVLEEWF